MARLYFYKLITDNGGAPHVTDGLLSLAICKPMIRRNAKPDDLILGFAANALHADNRLIYVAQITEKVDHGDYYTPTYAHRGDCIYERRDDRYVWRAGARYHGPDDAVHDLGLPPEYPKASVLLSNAFRYFGASGSADYKGRYPAVADAVENLGRGHRVEHAPRLLDALHTLARVTLTEPVSADGTPTSAPSRGACLRDGEVCVVNEDGVLIDG